MNPKGWKNIGLLALRIGLGLSFIFIHGGPKLFGGVEEWQTIGKTMETVFGITSGHTFWGFMAAISEGLGGLCLLLGLFFRPALVFLMITMGIAASMHTVSGDPLTDISYPLEMLVVFISLYIIGPGSFSLDYMLTHSKS